MTNDVDHILNALISHLYIFDEMIIQTFYPF